MRDQRWRTSYSSRSMAAPRWARSGRGDVREVAGVACKRNAHLETVQTAWHFQMASRCASGQAVAGVARCSIDMGRFDFRLVQQRPSLSIRSWLVSRRVLNPMRRYRRSLLRRASTRAVVATGGSEDNVVATSGEASHHVSHAAVGGR